MTNGIGGKIRGISLDSFMQVVQMDRMTCTLKVTSKEGFGFLYFVEGELFSATTGDQHHAEAACRIISWEGADIEIKSSCEKTVNEIRQPLMNILMEGMRLRDEAKEKPQNEPNAQPPAAGNKPAEPARDAAKTTPAQPEPAPAQKPIKIEAAASHAAKAPRRRKWILAVAGLTVLVLLLGGVMAAFSLRAEKQKADYENVLSVVERTIPPDKQLALLKTYIAENPKVRFAEDARRRINDLIEKIAENELSEAEARSNALVESGDLQKALALFEPIERKYPSSRFSSRIDSQKKRIRELIDIRAYEALLQQTDTMGPERVAAYLDFLKSNPESRYRREIENLIAAMSEEYYAYTERRILENEQLKNWETCFHLSQQYIDIYPYATKQIEILRAYQTLCRQETEAAKAFADLKQQAEKLGDNDEAIIKLYSGFLQANPQTRAKNEIEQEIAAYQTRSEKKRIAIAHEKMRSLFQDHGARFKIHEDGTISDARTGLMWCLLDSTAQLQRCLEFQEAKVFVEALDTGGHTDWRLPEKEELTMLYREKPYFPSTGPTWYWTNQTHKRYLGRWMLDVEVVTTETRSEEEVANKESWHCGSVRAVRGGRK